MDDVLSRHRLRQPYRVLLVALWLAPVGLLVAAVVIGKGMTPALFDPRLLLLLALMAVPALYVWQEGVDARRGGLTVRIQVPRFYAYTDLGGWHLAERPEGHILTVWDRDRSQVLAYHAAHLTNLPRLLHALETHLHEPRS